MKSAVCKTCVVSRHQCCITRRSFLAMGVGAMVGNKVAGKAIAPANGSSVQSQTSQTTKRQARVRIGVLFTGAPGPADRGWCTDATQVEAIRKHLSAIERKLGNVELVLGEARNPSEAGAFLERLGSGAPVLAINLNIFALTSVAGPLLERNHPTVVFSLPASGHDWLYPPLWQKKGHHITLLASSDYNELERGIRLLRVIPLLQQTRVLLFPPAQGTPPACSPEQVKARFGIEVVMVDEKRFDQTLNSVPEEAVRTEAKRWKEGAKQILEPTDEDILKAARVSIALNRLVDEEQANGLAVGTCMGWLPKGFPCLGFSRLRDRGIPASCEGDMDSLLTMLLFQYAFDLPGFQGNTVFDTAKNAVWTAHCTAPLKMDGPQGPEAPYLLRSHSEVGGGCVPEVQYRVGERITRAKLVNLDTILLSTGKIIEVPEKSVHGCRTQIVTEVKDAAKMLFNWGGGVLDETVGAMTLLHRVVFYGDHTQSVYHLAHLLGLKVVEEG